MAKNQVTLTFAGDSSSLERSFDKIGSSAKDMEDDVGKASRSFDRVGESADNAEGRFTGLASGIDGVTTLMDDPSPQEFAQGIADIADGIANFAVPAIKALSTNLLSSIASAASAAAAQATAAATTVAGWIAMGIQSTINAAKMAAAWLISLGPIGLLIAGVAAVIAILVSLGFGFDDLKNVASAAWNFILNVGRSVFNWLKNNWPLLLAILTGPFGLAVLAISRNWQSIKDGATAVKNWIVNRFNDVVSFISGLPGAIADAASGMWDGIISAFKAAINSIIGLWNNLSFPSVTVGGGDPLGAFGPSLPSVTLGGWDLPNIPYLHTGGTFQAPRGQREGLAMLLDGERVSRPGQNEPSIVINVAGSVLSERDLVRVIRDEIQRGGFGRLL